MPAELSQGRGGESSGEEVAGWLGASKGHSRSAGGTRPRVSPNLHTTHNP